MSMSEDERAVLADAPAAVFVLVAGADGKVDDKERARFAEILTSSAAPGAGALGELLALASTRTERALEALDAGASEALLKRAAEVAGGALSADDCAAFKRGLLFIAERVASASGGGPLGLGKRTAAEERAAIDRLKALLG